MAVLESKTVLPEFIKLRWQEPYVSAGLNRKTFKTIPRGVYNGFVIKPGPGSQQIQVVHDDVSGWGLTCGYSYGAFDSASGWSIAVHASISGYTSTVAIQTGPDRNFVFDVSGYAGQTVFAALDVQYQQGYGTTGQVKLVQAVDLDAEPTLLCLGRVDVPALGDVQQANIIYDDSAYPRVLPFADIYKYGYMSKDQAYHLDLVTSNGVSGAPAFEDEVDILVDGPQTINLPTSQTYTYNGDDLWVFKNGVKQKKGASRDYIEVDRGDGRGEQITWVGGNLRAGDRILFRVQKYSAVLSSTTKVLDESSVIETNTIEMNFVGSGVAVTPEGYRRVKITIPGGGGGGGSTRTKFNASGITIPAGTAVHLLSNNTITACNPLISTHKFYGIALNNIANGFLGDVVVNGVAEGMGAGLGTIGEDVYVSQLGDGSLTISPPDPVSGSVFRVGILDGASSVSGGVAADIVFDKARLT